MAYISPLVVCCRLHTTHIPLLNAVSRIRWREAPPTPPLTKSMAPEAPTPSLVERHARQKEWNTYWTNRYDWLLNSGYEIRPDYNPTGPLPTRDQRPFSPLLDAEGKADPRHTYQMDVRSTHFIV